MLIKLINELISKKSYLFDGTQKEKKKLVLKLFLPACDKMLDFDHSLRMSSFINTLITVFPHVALLF